MTDVLPEQFEALAARVAELVVARLQEDPPVPNDFLDTKSAAQFLGLSGRHLEYMRRVGEGPAFTKVGARVRYELDDLRAWARGREVDNEG